MHFTEPQKATYDFTYTTAMNWNYVCVSHPPESYVEGLTPNAMVFANGAFERKSSLNEVIEGPPIPQYDISVFLRRKKRKRDQNSVSMWRWICAGQEAGSHQKQNLLAPWFWTSQPPELWERNVCYWNHPVHNNLL